MESIPRSSAPKADVLPLGHSCIHPGLAATDNVVFRGVFLSVFVFLGASQQRKPIRDCLINCDVLYSLFSAREVLTSGFLAVGNKA